MVRRGLLAGLTLVAASPAWAGCVDILPTVAEAHGPQRRIEARDLIELRDIGMPDPSYFFLPSPLAVSPDGKSIAVLLSRGDIASNGYCRALVVISTSSGAAPPRVVDRGGDMITATDVKRGLFVNTGFPDLVVPAWSPDGRWIGYLKRVDGVTQLWRAHADGTGAVAVTRSAVDVERWSWAPNGRDLLYASRPGIAAARLALDREALTGYLYDGRVRPNPGPRPQLREADVPQAVYLVDPETGLDRGATDAEAAALPPDLPGGSQPVSLAVSGEHRAWTERDAPGPLSPSRIWVTGRSGRKQPCPAAACRDGIVNLWWLPDGSLVFLRREGWAKGRMALYRWRPGQRTARRFLASPTWLTGCTYHDARLYCVSEDAITPRQVVAIDLASGRRSLLFDPNPGFARLRLGKVQRLTWKSETGMPAWGDLVLPPDAAPDQKLPLVIVQYHSDGFLRGGTGDAHPIFLLAAHGFAVLSFERPAVESGAFPGLKTVDAIIEAMTKDWGERRSVLSSLLAGVDRTLATGVVDPQRIGITGLSDGASTVNYALINSNRFAAASISTCCEDPRTVMTYGGTAWADWNRAVRHYPLATEDGTAFWKPMALSLNAERIGAPILMQLADSEYLLALEAFTALREHDKPVEMYVSPGEFHTRTQPLHRLAEYERDIDWFGFWLLSREDLDPAKRAQYVRWRALRAARSPVPPPEAEPH